MMITLRSSLVLCSAKALLMRCNDNAYTHVPLSDYSKRVRLQQQSLTKANNADVTEGAMFANVAN